MRAPMAALGRAPAVLAGCLLAGSMLTGCARANPYSLPEYDPAATGAAAVLGSAPGASAAGGSAGGSAAGTGRGHRPDVVPRAATPSPQVRYRPADALGQGAWVERGQGTGGSPAGRAAVDTVIKYLSVRVQLSNTWQVDESALAATASGQAVTSARERAERQRARRWRSVGRFIVNVSSVRVDGTAAAVTGCHFDATSEVDPDGNVQVAPPGGVLITMHLRRTGSTWRVLDWPERAVPSCDWRA